MNLYYVEFESISGEPLEIELLHEDEMTDEELLERLREIAKEEGFAGDRMASYCASERFGQFFTTLIDKYGFQPNRPNVKATTHIDNVIMAE